jgi:hypothetical protein
MKKLWLLFFVPLVITAGTYSRLPIQFPDTIMVGTDTMWSYPVPIEGVTVSCLNGMSIRLWMYSNDTCIMGAYFKCLDTKDTLLMDSLAYSPTGLPGDSTIFTGYVVPTSARVIGAPIWSDVTGCVRIGLYMIGEATDTVWVGPFQQGSPARYRYLKVDYIGGN